MGILFLTIVWCGAERSNGEFIRIVVWDHELLKGDEVCFSILLTDMSFVQSH